MTNWKTHALLKGRAAALHQTVTCGPFDFLREREIRVCVCVRACPYMCVCEIFLNFLFKNNFRLTEKL